MCYYSQVWYLALNGEPLINDEFEVWTHGLVCRNLWNRMKEYRGYEIPIDELKKLSKGKLNKIDENFLKEIKKVYGKYSGDFLETQAHKEISWINSRKGLKKGESGRHKISKNDMKQYYLDVNLYDGIDENSSNFKIDNIYSKENQKSLQKSIMQFKNGEFEEHELIEVDND